MDKKFSIIYLSTGNISFHRQTIFSILSLKYFYKTKPFLSFQIIVFTDNVKFFKDYFGDETIKLIFFTPELLNSWIPKKENPDFAHPSDLKAIAKPMVIKTVLENYSRVAVFVDTDTYFLKPPDELFKKINKESVLMWRREGILSDKSKKHWETLRQIFCNNTFMYDEKEIKIPLNIYMWNSGVIGLNFENTDLLNNMVSLSLQLLKISKSPYVYHQIMVSYVLQDRKVIYPTDEIILHYCYGNKKANFNKILKRFFKKEAKKLNYSELLERVHKISLQEIPNEPVTNIYKEIKTFFNKRITGLNMAINRVKKSKKILSFFDRGKIYE